MLRNFTGPKARLESGPDVFADALVPRNAPRSPERLPFRLPRLLTPGAFDPSKSLLPCSDRRWSCRAFACAFMRRGSPTQHVVLPRNPTGNLQDRIRSRSRIVDARQRRDDAMVIVVRNGRVNRTSRIGTCPCSTATSAISPLPRAARVYIPFIANLKPNFKFDRS